MRVRTGRHLHHRHVSHAVLGWQPRGGVLRDVHSARLRPREGTRGHVVGRGAGRVLLTGVVVVVVVVAWKRRGRRGGGGSGGGGRSSDTPRREVRGGVGGRAHGRPRVAGCVEPCGGAARKLCMCAGVGLIVPHSCSVLSKRLACARGRRDHAGGGGCCGAELAMGRATTRGTGLQQPQRRQRCGIGVAHALRLFVQRALQGKVAARGAALPERRKETGERRQETGDRRQERQERQDRGERREETGARETSVRSEGGQGRRLSNTTPQHAMLNQTRSYTQHAPSNAHQSSWWAQQAPDSHPPRF